RLANRYNSALEINPVNKDASVITISMIEPVVAKGIDIINKLVEVYNRETVEDKNQIAENTVKFIDERLNFLVTELSEVERNVERYKQEHEITNVSAEAERYLQEA